MAAPKTAWGIDIGQCALKAIKLRSSDEGLHVEAFEVVEHSSVLSQSETDAAMVIKASLSEFLGKVGDISGSEVAVSVLGQGGITKFVTLPPVDAKKIPDIVKFEAQQQIPFPLEEVTWRYQTFQSPDSPQVEAGIFAVKQVSVVEMLSHFRQSNVSIDLIQMSPLALYNYMNADGLVGDQAVMLADVGAEKTHIIVADKNNLWTRAINIGGNSFTEALMKNFKLSFSKAEQLKKNASSSKYARQIFQVMRPIFSSLNQQIQRSIGFYTSIHRDCKFTQLLGTGNGFKLPGMQKYLEQNLNMPVKRIDKFQKLGGITPEMQDKMLGFAVPYGLAAQALGKGIIDTNMLPEAVVKQRLWKKKKPWFIGAAASFVLAAGLYANSQIDKKNQLANPNGIRRLKKIERFVNTSSRLKKEYAEIQSSVATGEEKLASYQAIRGYTKFWPEFNHIFNQAWEKSEIIGGQDATTLQEIATKGIENVSEQKLLNLRKGTSKIFVINRLPSLETADVEDSAKQKGLAAIRETLVKNLRSIPRSSRDITVIESQTATYIPDFNTVEEFKTKEIETAKTPSMQNGQMQPTPGQPPMPPAGGQVPGAPVAKPEAVRGFVVTVNIRTTLSSESFNNTITSLRSKLIEMINKNEQMEVFNDKMISKVNKIDTNATEVGGGFGGGFGGGGATNDNNTISSPDPLFPKESTSKDLRVTIKIPVVIKSDGISKPKKNTPAKTNNK